MITSYTIDTEIAKENEEKQEKFSTIVRIVHNRENPYVQLNKKALWDNNLSLKAAGLWARCMSRPNDWKFNLKELIKSCKEGRRAVDAAMQELIKFNYVIRLEYYKKDQKGKFQKGCGGVEYVFFEFPATEEEKQEQLDIFKKSLRDCCFGDCRNVHLLKKEYSLKENTRLKKENNPLPLKPTKPVKPKKEEKEEKKEVSKKDDEENVTSRAIALRLGECFLSQIKEKKPNFSKNITAAWIKSFERLLKIRTEEEIIKLISWVINDPFWSANVLCPSKLEKKLDQLEMKMNQVINPSNPLISQNSKPVIDRRLKDKDGNFYDNPWKDVF